uniref:Uncharacterized protein n=1 Tax=Oryza rufipogon TaxID=4529 RepID=A0A0E0R9H3_ORYRU
MVMECALEAGAEPCRLLRTRRAGGRGTRLRCAVAAERPADTGKSQFTQAVAISARAEGKEEGERLGGGGREERGEAEGSGRDPWICGAHSGRPHGDGTTTGIVAL